MPSVFPAPEPDTGPAPPRANRGVPRRARGRTIGGAALLAAAAAGLGCFLLLRGPAVPPEAEGQAWLAGFADRLTAPATWRARGPASLALFPGLGPWSTGTCVLTWSRRDPFAPIVTYQRLELGRLGADEPCDQAQFGMLSTTLRQSEGITPGALGALFTDRFGPPAIHRDTSLRGAITYAWQVQDGIFAHLEERVQPGGADTFSLLFVRSTAAPTTSATAQEGERWMDRTVDLVTGPALAEARGPAAVARLVDADLEPDGKDAATCPTSFDANPLTKGPIGSGHSLRLERPDGAPCEQARFAWLSVRIWQREPVTAAAVAGRLDARMGAATLSRDFDRNAVRYRWTTAGGIAVELTEDLSAAGRHWLGLRAWRP